MPALACTPDRYSSYDDLNSQDILIATANVTTVDFVTSETEACMHIVYSAAQYVYGIGPKEFSVTTCWNDIDQTETLAEQTDGLGAFGFLPEAEVFLGLVYVGEGSSQLRYAEPSCWGPLHVNLDDMSSNEQTEFIQGFANQIENTE